jgi:hypothetical protein
MKFNDAVKKLSEVLDGEYFSVHPSVTYQKGRKPEVKIIVIIVPLSGGIVQSAISFVGQCWQEVIDKVQQWKKPYPAADIAAAIAEEMPDDAEFPVPCV